MATEKAYEVYSNSSHFYVDFYGGHQHRDFCKCILLLQFFLWIWWRCQHRDFLSVFLFQPFYAFDRGWQHRDFLIISLLLLFLFDGGHQYRDFLSVSLLLSSFVDLMKVISKGTFKYILTPAFFVDLMKGISIGPLSVS